MTGYELGVITVASTALAYYVENRVLGILAAALWVRFGFYNLEAATRDVFLGFPALLFGIYMLLSMIWSQRERR